MPSLRSCKVMGKKPTRAKTLVCHEDVIGVSVVKMAKAVCRLGYAPRSWWLSVDRRLTAHELRQIQQYGVFPQENLEQRRRWLLRMLMILSSQHSWSHVRTNIAENRTEYLIGIV